MGDSQRRQRAPSHDRNRRRTLLLALAGAGAPLGHRVISGQWVAPVVDAVLLPAHAATSQSFATGMFSSELSDGSDPTSSPFANIAERSEEEILDLFVKAAEAGPACPIGNYCDSEGTASIDVVATIDSNPTSSACIQARVNISGASCSALCLIFNFENVHVEGETVSLSTTCDELTLSGMSVTETGLTGHWQYESSDPSHRVTSHGKFTAPPGAVGCGALGCY